MRVCMSLVFLVAMMALGCGDSDKKVSSDGGNGNGETNGPDDSGAGNAGGNADAAPEDPWKDCDREMIDKELEGYTGPMPTFSEADADKCREVCMNQAQDCYAEDNCPGIEVFETCLNRSAFACSASEGKACRADYENVECCGLAAGCEDLTCLEDKCPSELKALNDCRVADTTCRMSATTACFGSDATGNPDGGAADTSAANAVTKRAPLSRSMLFRALR